MSNIIYLGDEAQKELHELPNTPGIYKFLNEDKEIIYIGKAKDLSKRTKSYFSNLKNKTRKLKTLISETRFLDITITSTELEALLLEQHSIKQHRPKFNVQFKDDKGYPWIKISGRNDFPSINYFLGKNKSGDLLYGPYPNRSSVRDALLVIQRTFKLRNCTDSFFKSRTRPCLQYEIGRCSAPCDGRVSKEDYQIALYAVQQLLSGNGKEAVTELYAYMDQNSKLKNYEKASYFRDQIISIREVQKQQSITGFKEDRDAVVFLAGKSKNLFGVTEVRGGWITSHQTFYVESMSGEEKNILEEFLLNHYLSVNYCPSKILLDSKIPNIRILNKVLSKQHAKKVSFIHRLTSKDVGLLKITSENTNLINKNSLYSSDLKNIYKLIGSDLGLKKPIKRIECYDISHSSGSTPVGACVVFGLHGKIKSEYRIYNISQELGGNDLESLRELVRRRYKRKQMLPPDLIIVDGGRNQLNAVSSQLISLGLFDISVIGISKGHRRKSENDSLHLLPKLVLPINKTNKGHSFLQQIRNEAHRFAINNLKKKRVKLIRSSLLEEISGIGKAKKSILIRYFSSLEKIAEASLSDLEAVPGIGRDVAQSVYKTLKN